MRSVLVVGALVVATAASHAEVNTSPKARLAAVARVARQMQPVIPSDYWRHARCIVVFPELDNEKLAVGGKYATGAISCRIGDGWSAPAFVELHKGKRMCRNGAPCQMGLTVLDIVLLLMNDAVVETVRQHTVTLDADASIAPGPIDTQPRVDPVTSRADILTYSRAKGLFMNLSGGVLRADHDMNASVYGGRSSLRTILETPDLAAPSPDHAFILALSTQPAPPVLRPAGGDALRARIMEMQRTVDGLIATTAPPTAAVGTTGTLASPEDATKPTVDRARLIQLQRQLEAMLATLARR